MPPATAYRVLHRIADGHVGKAERAFLRYARTSAANVDLPSLRAALRAGSSHAILEALGADTTMQQLRQDLARVLQSTFAQSGVAAAASTPILRGTFNLANPRAIEYARTRAARLVREVTKGTERAIRGLVTQAMREGQSVDALKRLIRDTVPKFGLTERQQATVDRFAERLRRDGFDDAEVQARTARYAQQTLTRRARTIARTETIVAANNGQRELWMQSRDAGRFDDADARRIWIVTEDDRLCETCEAIPELNPDGVGLDEPFLTPDGLVMSAGEAHPNCRCAEGLIFRADEAEAAA